VFWEAGGAMTAVAVAGRSADLRSLSDEPLAQLDGWFRSADDLSVGQIYLWRNPPPRNRLSGDDVTPQLLGHRGAAPGLNFVYAHPNRFIKERQDSDDIPGVRDWVWPDARSPQVEAGVGRHRRDRSRQLINGFSLVG
jgi:XFP N-terminal domain